MDNWMKVLLSVLVIAYVISPIDAMPGPIDDVVVLLCGYVANKKIMSRTID